ncbi:Erg [Parasponia andersonii]|uniref:Erg n=1 Tax=Parasponia andersonii TaxID=3476 RepID=A0A2P5C2B9_PARAD|nr:Erg [Parasponia andersonii]
MKPLSLWLMVVGSLRLASVWFGFFDIWALRLAVFSQTQMTEVHGRTFGVWTLLTCTLCFLCAFNLENKPLYLATFLSFIYALGHFLTEYLVYHTMAVANLSTVGFFAAYGNPSVCHYIDLKPLHDFSRFRVLLESPPFKFLGKPVDDPCGLNSGQLCSSLAAYAVMKPAEAGHGFVSFYQHLSSEQFS